jgi:hypothetical protein
MRQALLVALALVASSPQHVGTVTFETSCSAAAKPAFVRGVALLHSFAFPAADEAFRSALSADPHCAMALWGMALDAWGNPFAAGLKSDAQLARGLEAIKRAAVMSPGTPRERAYVDAATKLYADYPNVDQQTRVNAYCEAMRVVAATYPDDIEASIFYALSLAFSADPTDKTYANQLKAGAMLERLWPDHPDHPGLAHYIIHSYDVPALAPRALDAARRYASIAPEEPHALHMPSHTFTRVGDWQASIETNLLSVAAAKREGSTAEELHASDYLMYAYLQSGQDVAAQRVLDAIGGMSARFDPGAMATGAPPAAGFFAVAAIPARHSLERGDWAGAAHLTHRQTPVAFADATTDFARAIGAARSGDRATAADALRALDEDGARLLEAHETYWAGQVNIQHLAAAAWLAFAEGYRDDALRAMRDAADREDATEKNAITPGPLAPAREMLGEMLLEAGQPSLALAAFEQTLRHEPNRFRTLAGAMAAATAAGDRTKARMYATQLLAVCGVADRPGRAELALARQLSSGG